MNIFELREKSLKIAHEARDLIASNDKIDAETSAKIDTMLAESDALEARAKQLDAIEAREKAFNASTSRAPVETTEARTNTTTDEEKRANAFNEYLRGNIGERELRAQGIATPAGGGNLVPTTFYAKLIEVAKAYGPLNEGGPVTYLVTDSGEPIITPKLDDTGNMGHQIAENTEVNETNLSFGNVTLGAYKYTSDLVKVSNELMQDSAIDVQDVVVRAMGVRIGRILNKDFTTGDGVTQPQGIVTGAGVGATAAGATAITLADFINLEMSVDAAYRDKIEFMMNDATFGKLRLLNDTTGRPLWTPAYTVGAPALINGKRFYINNAMDSTIASGKVSVLAGDFSQFTVRRVREFAVKRLDERFATADQVGFVGFGRYDSKVMDSSAIKKLTH